MIAKAESDKDDNASAVSYHPLQSDETQRMEGEEQGRLLKGEESGRPSYTARAQTFAGRGKKASTYHEGEGLGRLNGANVGVAKSWDQPEAGGEFGRRNAPPRLATISRSVSQYGTPSIGTGYEGHTSYRFNVDEDQVGTQAWRAGAVGSTPLERTIDAIGMGRYQYAVLILSGFGWAADNMWLQGVAIVLPRVQDEWQIGDQWIGLVSSCTFAGMMVGALAWGSCECRKVRTTCATDRPISLSDPFIRRFGCIWTQECLQCYTSHYCRLWSALFHGAKLYDPVPLSLFIGYRSGW
jgi:hypothetical protein